MKRFTQFLTESSKQWSENDFKAILASSHTLEPFDQKGGEALRTRYLPKVINFMNTHAEGDIANPVVKEIGSYANYVTEAATKFPERIYSIIRGNRDAEMWDAQELVHFSYINYVPGKLKKAEALAKKTKNSDVRTLLDWALPILRELAPIATFVESAKKRAVKRVVKSAEEREEEKRYKPPVSSRESVHQVTAVLTKLTDALKLDYAKSVTEWLISEAERWNRLTEQERKDEVKRNKFRRPQIASERIWKLERPWDSYDNARLDGNYKSVLEASGKRAADDMQRAFLVKNVAKLVSILEKKGTELRREPRILKASASYGIFEGDIEISFLDNSSFIVRNKIVWKRNQYGTNFNQFPTTFHNVVMPDGKPMGQPSEERMNSVFVSGTH